MEKRLFEALKKLEARTYHKDELYAYLLEQGYLANDEISEKGLLALEPYRVKRAIIMAAGFGSRMVPITLTTPKPLVSVNGTRFIDTLIGKLINVGITDITVVRGYLKEKFDVLLEKYPFLKFVDNDKYNEENNISSAILVKDLFSNCYLCEADFYITGDDVIEKYQYETNYLCSPFNETSDWCFDLDSNGYLTNYRKGGKNCLQAYGISYWNQKDGEFLKQKLTEMYMDINNRQMFWEMSIFDLYKNEFNIKPRYVKRDSIVEIDSYAELCEIDHAYI